MRDKSQAQRLIKDFEVLKGDRANFEDHWRQVAERVVPAYKDEFQCGSYGNRTQGETKTEYMFDATASIALGRFSAIMASLLTPMNTKWHKLKASNTLLNKDRSVRLWFDEATDILFKYRYSPMANFASQNLQIFKLLGAFGNGPMFIDELADRPGLRYKACNLATTYIRENHQGLVDSVMRSFTLTSRQAFIFWPDNLPERILKEVEKGGEAAETKHQFLHVVKPKEDVDPTKKDFRGMPFASYYVCMDEEHVVEEGGYRSFPYAIARHEQYPNETYARSPAMEVLPAIKTLNEQKKTVLKQGHRITDPIILAHDDGIASEFAMRPGSVNYGFMTKEGRPLAGVLPTGNIAVGKDMMDDERRDINDAFLITLFQILVETPTKTATEVLELVKEKGILLAPNFGRQEAEYLGPMIERELSLLMSQGLLPPLPDALIEAQGEYEIEYDSPFTRTQRAEEGSGYMRFFEWMVAQATNTQNPELLDLFDTDKAVPELAAIHALPERWIRGDAEVKAIRQQRAQIAAQQDAIAAAPGEAALIKSAAVAQEKAPELVEQALSQ